MEPRRQDSEVVLSSTLHASSGFAVLGSPCGPYPNAPRTLLHTDVPFYTDLAKSLPGCEDNPEYVFCA